MGHTDPRQDKKAHIIGEEMEIAFSGFNISANESLARGNVPRCGAKQKTGERIIVTIKGHVLDVLADGAGVTEIMVAGEKSFKEVILLAVSDRRHVDWGQRL